jgi:LysM repeat protein
MSTSNRKTTLTVLLLLVVLLAACQQATLPPEPTLDLSSKKATATPAAVKPTATPGLSEVEGPTAVSVTHKVKPGDTLAKIAQQYNVAVDEIMAVNGLDDPNVIKVGQELAIPVEEAAKPAAEESPTPAVSPSAPAAEGWQFRADMFIMFEYEALDCAQVGINYGPEDEALALGAVADEMAQAYVQGKDIDAQAKEKGVKYLWSNVYAYGHEIGDMSIGQVDANACTYAREWKIFDGVDLAPLTGASVVNIADIRRDTVTGWERRILIVWKEG